VANPRLNLEFYQRDTKKVARDLIGKILYHRRDGIVTAGVITETEAYLGIRDSACHTYRGRRTERVASMYKMGGHAYVYLIYGLHFCFNVVTKDEEHPEAVLIRGLEPYEGIDQMRQRRGIQPGKRDRDLCSGPGKLCQAMAIDRACDGMSLASRELWIAENPLPRKFRISSGPRVGIDYAIEPVSKPARDWPLRFRMKF
jgi:DNA-3-methyladenine glycosylase